GHLRAEVRRAEHDDAPDVGSWIASKIVAQHEAPHAVTDERQWTMLVKFVDEHPQLRRGVLHVDPEAWIVEAADRTPAGPQQSAAEEREAAAVPPPAGDENQGPGAARAGAAPP